MNYYYCLISSIFFIQIQICQEVLEAFKEHTRTDDAVLLNSLFDVGRLIHDGVDR